MNGFWLYDLCDVCLVWGYAVIGEDMGLYWGGISGV